MESASLCCLIAFNLSNSALAAASLAASLSALFVLANSIGLNLIEYSQFILKRTIEFIRENFIPEKESPSIVPPYFYINTPSNNKKLHFILNQLDLKSIQISFKI